jgi:hypothetical protein
MNDQQDMQPFLIRPLALVVGVSLPLLLVVVFWLAMAIPRLCSGCPATGWQSVIFLRHC